MRRLIMLATIVFTMSTTAMAQDGVDAEGFVSLFDGKTLEGWVASKENPDSFSVEEDVLVCRGGKSHLFYDGPVGNADFKNFELKLKAKTTPGSNSGVYFHTTYQDEGWPDKGFEAQVNSTHKDPKKTGSLYGIVNMYVPKEDEPPFIARQDRSGVSVSRPEPLSKDGEWFEYHIVVVDKHVTLKVNGETTVDWIQPVDFDKTGGTGEGRVIDHGTIGFQAHDPDSLTYFKDIKIKVLD